MWAGVGGCGVRNELGLVRTWKLSQINNDSLINCGVNGDSVSDLDANNTMTFDRKDPT